MELGKANELLPVFLPLAGKMSISYGQKIKDVFVGYEDRELTREMYGFSKRVEAFATLPSDKGKYTICVAFEDNSIVSIKMLVLKDNISDLIPIVEPLDYMTYRLRGKKPNEYEDFQT